MSPTPSRLTQCAKIVFLVFLLAWLSLVFWNSAKPLPPGTHIVSQVSRLSEADVDFLYDSPQHTDILAREMSVIDHAEQLIVLDRSPVTPELTQHLLARKRLRPNLKVVLVTDPGNEAFGGTPAPTLASLEQAGIIVAQLRLDRLRQQRNALIRFHTDQGYLLDQRVAEIRAQLVKLEGGEVIEMGPVQ